MKQAEIVGHTNKVINNLEYLVSEVKEIEYNYHGYLATSDESFAGNLKVATVRTDSIYHLLRNITLESLEQQKSLDTIKIGLDRNTANLKTALNFLEFSPSRIQVRDSLSKMEYLTSNRAEIRRQIRLMQYTEEGYLQLRIGKMTRFSSAIEVINLVSLVLSFLLALISLATYRKEKSARSEANIKSENYKQELESRVDELAIANKEVLQLRNIEKFAATGRISRTIAHEVRNPLTNINLATEQLKESIQGTEENTMLLEMIKRNSLRINQLISNLLNATKFSELVYQKASVNHIIDQALELAADRINLKHIIIEKHYSQDLRLLDIDEEKMKIAFLNIIVNAIEAMNSDNALLQITTQTDLSKCKIVFEDNGTGMNEETITKLFEPFFTKKETGNGLGLTNTQNIILNHKGKIEVESVEGTGTKIIIYLDVE